VTARLSATLADGVYRVTTPQQTFARINPLLAEMGITRAADVTGLDRLGIPTWCAIRPNARQVQVANGKGLSHPAAKVSALMEAIEHWHAEYTEGDVRAASTATLVRDGVPHVAIGDLPDYEERVHLTDDRVVHWVRAESLVDGARVWVPACAVYLIEPRFVHFSTNGLASGNHVVEATLHGLYEVIERDAVSRLKRGGLFLPRGESHVIDLDTLPAGPVALLRDRLQRAGVQLVLIRVESIRPISTFWAVLLDSASPFACSYVNMGHGSHLSPIVAAIRAITEAAQSRLTFIQGSREDLWEESYEFGETHTRVYSFFERQRGDLPWDDIADHASGDLLEDLETVVSGVASAGYTRVYRIDLTSARFGIPVVKVLVPGLLNATHQAR
jgi:ribosomal protein S12 methylthiotransferase accessory factor